MYIASKLTYKILKLLLLTLMTNPMYAQQNFESYVNRLFFNIYLGNADSTIDNFLKDYVPAFFRKPQDSVQWTAYSSEKIDPPTIITHSVIFNKHPFINENFKRGEFKVFTNVYTSAPYENRVGVAKIQITLEFLKLEDAVRVFDQIRKDLKSIAEEQIFQEDSSKVFSEIYSNEQYLNIPCGLGLYLSKERSSDNLYHLCISS